MSRSLPRPIILLVEDSEDDAFFFRDALRRSGVECELKHAVDGHAALSLLAAAVQPDAAATVDLLFLDLKIPGPSGFDVLTWIAAHAPAHSLSVAVLSGSEEPADVARAHALGAASYLVKPITREKIREQVEAWRRQHAAASQTLQPGDASFSR